MVVNFWKLALKIIIKYLILEHHFKKLKMRLASFELKSQIHCYLILRIFYKIIIRVRLASFLLFLCETCVSTWLMAAIICYKGSKICSCMTYLFFNDSTQSTLMIMDSKDVSNW
jgi:hypothetical protein